MLHYDTHSTDCALERLLTQYERSGRPIPVDFRKLVPSLHSVDRATHLLHPYPAKLLMHIPFFFLNNSILSKKGDVVADPFCGSGTVLLESQLAGRTAMGADSNPFARLLTKVKTSPISSPTLDKACDRLFTRIPDRPRGSPPDVVNLDYWFYPHVIDQLRCLHEAIQATRRQDIRDFFNICLSSCAKKVSLADPRLSVPVRLCAERYPEKHPLREKMERHIRRLKRVNVLDVFRDILNANRRRISTLEPLIDRLPKASVVSSDARQLCAYSSSGTTDTMMGDMGVQLAITSPPYPGAQKYIRSCSFSLGWLDLCRSDELIDFKLGTIGREEFRKIDCQRLLPTGISSADRTLEHIYTESPIRATIASTYLREMRSAIVELSRLVICGGYLVLVAANNKLSGRVFKTQQYLQLIAEETGFRTVLRLVDDIRSRGLMTKRNKTASVIAREWVLVLRKDG